MVTRKKLGTLKASDMGGKGWKDEKGTYPVYKEGNAVYLTRMGNSPYTKGQKWKIPVSVRSKIKSSKRKPQARRKKNSGLATALKNMSLS